MRALGLGERRQIDDPQVRVGRRLGQDHARTLGDRSGHARYVTRGDDRALDAEAAEPLRDERARAAVAIAGEDDMIALLQQREERRGDGGHAAAEERGVLAALERSKLLLRGAYGGIAVAPVFV